MASQHSRAAAASKRRKLGATGGSDAPALCAGLAEAGSAAVTDEELARRLHEELNAGMTRRRGSLPVEAKGSFLDVALEHKGLCAARSHNRAAAAGGGGGKGQHLPGLPPSSRDVGGSKGPRAAAAAAAAHAPASSVAPSSSPRQQEGATAPAPAPRSRKAPLSRELAKLVTDLVGMPGSPTLQQDARQRRKQQQGSGSSQQQQDQQQQRAGPSSSAEDTMDGLSDSDMEEGAPGAPPPAAAAAAARKEQRLGKRPLHPQQQQQQAAADPQQPTSKPAAANGSAAEGLAGGLVKQETSSCGSEQDRVLAEHLQLVAPGSPKQEKPAAEAQPAPPKPAPACSTSEASSQAGRGGSSSVTASGTSGGPGSASGSEAHQHRSSSKGASKLLSSADASGQQQGGSSPAPGGGCSLAAAPKIPKLPMVQYRSVWYRGRVLKQTAWKVLLEFTGHNHEGGPFWLPKDSPRLWRGSYKGRDWKYLGDGAWEPKPQRGSRGRPGRTSAPPKGGARGAAARAAALQKKAAATAGGAAAITAHAAASDSDSDCMEEDTDEGSHDLEEPPAVLPPMGVGAAAAAAVGGGRGRRSRLAPAPEPTTDDEAAALEATEPVLVQSQEEQQQQQVVAAAAQDQGQLEDEDMADAPSMEPAAAEGVKQEFGEGAAAAPASAELPSLDVPPAAADAAPAVKAGSDAAVGEASPAALGVGSEGGEGKPDLDVVAPFAAPSSLRVRTSRSRSHQQQQQQQQGGSEADTPRVSGTAAGRRGRSNGAAAAAAALAHPTGKRSTRGRRGPRGGAGRLALAAGGSAAVGGEALGEVKGSCSSDALGAAQQPKSPTGGSPRAHRRKGIPQRSRLESGSLNEPLGGRGSGSTHGSMGSLARSGSLGGNGAGGRSGSEPDLAAVVTASNFSWRAAAAGSWEEGGAPGGVVETQQGGGSAVVVITSEPPAAVADALLLHQHQPPPEEPPAAAAAADDGDAEEVGWDPLDLLAQGATLAVAGGFGSTPPPAAEAGEDLAMDDLEAAALVASLNQAPRGLAAEAAAAAAGEGRPSSPAWEPEVAEADDGDSDWEPDTPSGRWGGGGGGGGKRRGAGWGASAATAASRRPPRHPAHHAHHPPLHPPVPPQALHPAPARVSSRSIDRVHQQQQQAGARRWSGGAGSAGPLPPATIADSQHQQQQQQHQLGARASDGARLSYNSGGSNLVNNLVNGPTPGQPPAALSGKPATLHRLLSAVGQLQLGGPELLADLYQQQVVPPLPVGMVATSAAAPAAVAAPALGVVAPRLGSCGRLLAVLPSLADVQDMAAAHASQAVAEGWVPRRDMPLFM